MNETIQLGLYAISGSITTFIYAVYLKIYKDIGLVVFKIRKKDLSDDVCV